MSEGTGNKPVVGGGKEPAVEHLETAHERIKALGELIEKSEWSNDSSKKLATFLYEDIDQALLDGIPSVAGGSYVDYEWRKYGVKDILGAKHPRKHPRNYYRCIHKNTKGCPAKKWVQQIDDGQATKFEIACEGLHTCMKNMPTPVTTTLTEMSMTGQQIEDAVNQNQVVQYHDYCRTSDKSMLSDNSSAFTCNEATSEIKSDTFADAYQWRKYSQKDILGSKHPRNYYRCIHRNTKGCLALKQVQQIDDGQATKFEVACRGLHTCTKNMPTPVTTTLTDMSMTDQQNDDAVNQNQVVQYHDYGWTSNKSTLSDNCSAYSELTCNEATSETSNCISEPSKRFPI